MNVGQVRTPDPAGKPVLIQRPAQNSGRSRGASAAIDEAQLSPATRGALRDVERLRSQDVERGQIVEAARAKLERGELGDPRVLRETARRILEQE